MANGRVGLPICRSDGARHGIGVERAKKVQILLTHYPWKPPNNRNELRFPRTVTSTMFATAMGPGVEATGAAAELGLW
jgi:hypothetical protein